MKKLMHFVVCLTLGLALSLVFGLASLIGKAVRFVANQISESAQKGSACLTSVSNKGKDLSERSLSLMKEQCKSVETKLSDSKRQVSDRMGALKETQIKREFRFALWLVGIRFKLKNHLTNFKNRISNEIKEMFKMKKFMVLVCGLMMAFFFVSDMKEENTDIEAVVESALVAKLEELGTVSYDAESDAIITALNSTDVIEDAEELNTFPAVIDNTMAYDVKELDEVLTSTEATVEDPKAETIITEEVTTQQAPTASTSTVESVQNQKPQVSEETKENNTTVNKPTVNKPVSSTPVETPSKPTVQSPVVESKPEVKPEAKPEVQPEVKPEVKPEAKPETSDKVEESQPVEDETTKEPVLMPGEVVIGGLIINGPALEEFVPEGGELMPYDAGLESSDSLTEPEVK